MPRLPVRGEQGSDALEALSRISRRHGSWEVRSAEREVPGVLDNPHLTTQGYAERSPGAAGLGVGKGFMLEAVCHQPPDDGALTAG
jgi:hypothetical protein